MTSHKTARVLIVAGSDSGGGAGIQADLKTVAMLGAHGMTAITAITAQNTLGVQAVMPVPTDVVMAQVESCLSDLGADAIKLGMIGSAATAHALADRFAGLTIPIVFDPVMVATSGSVLADADTIAAFGRLMDIATVVTPNRPELAALGGRDAVLARHVALFEKGGHPEPGEPEGRMLTDRLYLWRAGESVSWTSGRIDTPHTHGTGCTLASALATGLAQGLSLQQAAERARTFVRLALRDAPGLGAGHGPMGQQRVREDGLVPGLSLNQVTVPARDYAQSVAFWRALGLTQIVDAPENGYARFEADNGVTLSIQIGDAAPAATLYFEVADLSARCARLERAGIVFTHQARLEPWNWQEARLTDPAGNTICLYLAGENRRYPPWRVEEPDIPDA
jgi:hydroxymethylpyrimidine/phosphomethylpyrimidine kinase